MQDNENNDRLLSIIANTLEIPIEEIYITWKHYPSRSKIARIFYIHFSRENMSAIQSKLKICRRTFFYFNKLYYLKMRSSKEFRYYNDKIENVLYQRNKR